KVLVMKDKLFVGAYTEHIVQFPTRKLEIKIGRVKIKGSIIEYDVPAGILIQDPHRIVTKGTVKFITGIACQQANLIVLCHSLSLSQKSSYEKKGDDKYF